MKRFFILSIFTLGLLSCKEQPKNNEVSETKTEIPVVEEKKGTPFTQKIEAAHNKEAYKDKEAVTFNLDIIFGGKPAFKGKVTQLADGSKIRIDNPDGSKVIYDNEDVFICPKDANNERARFNIFTWSYFFSLPYKLNDPGTFWEAPVEKEIDGKPTQTAKLSFEEGTGDAPDDWYVVYQNPENSSLAGAAYIVSYGKTQSEAEKEPHAIKYHNYQKVDEVPIATKWTFHNWSDESGFGDEIGEATLSNIEFLNVSEALFNRPENSKIVPAPGN